MAATMMVAGLESWQALHWQQPYWIALLLPLLWLRFLARNAPLLQRPLLPAPLLLQTRLYRHPLAALLPGLKQGGVRTAAARWRSLAAGLLELLLLVLLVAALAQPYRLGEEVPQAPPQREIMFLLDSSVSMVLRDYEVEGERVDRIAMMKAVMRHLIQELGQSRLGISVFSELSYTLVPLTRDMGLAQRMLERLQPAMLTGRRSDLGKALYTVERELSESLGEGEPRPLLVLVSDVQQSGRRLDPRLLAEHVHHQGYTLHTIAIGAASQAAAERDSSGLIYQTTNFELLQQMAERGGGRFFWARDLAAMKQAVAEIQRGEVRRQQAAPIYVHIPLYHLPLLAALLPLMALQLLRLGWRR